MGRKKIALKYFEEQREYIEERISLGIERNRKGFAELSVKDRDGLPMKNIRLRAVQKNHEFKYGANLFMLEELETKEKNDIYKERFKEVFNLATLPFYWKDLEPEQDRPRFKKDSPRVYRRPTPDLCLEYCEENKIMPKAHCLNYMPWSPDWVPDDIDETKRLLDKRFHELADRYGNRIFGWEVINETMEVNGEKDRKFFREPDVVEWSFDRAKRYFKNNQLIINEASGAIWEQFKYNRSAYYMQIERALLNHASIDIIGMQYHMFYPREEEEICIDRMGNPNQLFTVLDQYAKLNKPIQITEVTIPAYSKDEEDEEIQAELLKWLYSMWFSHEAIEAIIYWNMVDGYAAFAPKGDMTVGENYYYGGLLRFDMSEKPAYKVIKDLFQKEWHTEDSCITDENGKTRFKGFYGNYKLTFEVDGKMIEKEINLSKKATNYFKIVL